MKSSTGKYHDLKGLGKMNLVLVCEREEEGVWLKKGVERAGGKLSHGSHDTVGGLGMEGREWMPEAFQRERWILPVDNCLWAYQTEGS